MKLEPVRCRPRTADIVLAGAVAAVLSGAPSTAWALATGNDPLSAARAAGVLLPAPRRAEGIARGIVVHAAVSATWATALGLAGRRWPLTPRRGAIAGLAIAALDLEIIGRSVPAIAVLPRGPQWADHCAFGAIFAWVATRRCRSLGAADQPASSSSSRSSSRS